MLIKLLAWLFKPASKPRRRSRNDTSVNDLLGCLLLLALVLGLWL